MAGSIDELFKDAMASLNAGRPDDAGRHFKALLRLQPNNIAALNILGAVLATGCVLCALARNCFGIHALFAAGRDCKPQSQRGLTIYKSLGIIIAEISMNPAIRDACALMVAASAPLSRRDGHHRIHFPDRTRRCLR